MTVTQEAPASPVGESMIRAVVEAVETVADDVVLLTLASTDEHPLPEWQPGAHIDLEIDGLVRQYSLCGRPVERDRYQVAVLLAPDTRGGSRAVHALVEGAEIGLVGPRNHFPLIPAGRYLFVAGGIGITPILPMIEEAERAGAEWELHYGGRSLASMAFRDLLAAHGERVHLVPQDSHGLLDLQAVLGTPRADTLVYCCGPEPLLNAVEERCAAWPPGSLHLERFSPKARDAAEVDTRFEVVLEQSGLTLTVEPGVSIFATMRAAGVSVLGSCLEGTCGTCEQTVLEGEVDHRDSVLDEAEREANDCMMICVSRANCARLVLDA